MIKMTRLACRVDKQCDQLVGDEDKEQRYDCTDGYGGGEKSRSDLGNLLPTRNAIIVADDGLGGLCNGIAHYEEERCVIARNAESAHAHIP